MIAMLLFELRAVALVAANDGGPAWLLLLGPAGGGAMYYGLWRYYRNTHQSHGFERETRIQATSVTGNEAKVDEVEGTRNSSIDGNNVGQHRERVQRLKP